MVLWLGQLPEKERLLPWELFIQCIPSARKASRAPRAASPTQHPRGAQGPGSDLAVIMWGKAKPCWVASSINVSQLGAEAFHIPNSDVISNNLAYSRGARGPLVALLALIFFGRSVQEKQKKKKTRVLVRRAAGCPMPRAQATPAETTQQGAANALLPSPEVLSPHGRKNITKTTNFHG